MVGQFMEIVMTDDKKTTCPYCKEDVKSGATKCRHCHSKLEAIRPAHEGICPYCKEDIKPAAIKCKHCQSNLLSTSKSGCNCDKETNISNEFQAVRRSENACTIGCIHAGGDVTRCSNACHCIALGGNWWDCVINHSRPTNFY